VIKLVLLIVWFFLIKKLQKINSGVCFVLTYFYLAVASGIKKNRSQEFCLFSESFDYVGGKLYQLDLRFN
jgi:hypothetical protein